MALGDFAPVRAFAVIMVVLFAAASRRWWTRRALAALGQRRPDALVSDSSMPEQDGYGLIRRVRASNDRGRSRIPVAALTTLARAEDRAAALAAGDQVHAAKPAEPAELARVVLDLSRGAR